MTDPEAGGSRRLWIWLLVACIGVMARLWLWWNSLGSNDVYIWSAHAGHILNDGLSSTYASDPAFNHPPLMGIYAAYAWKWSGRNLLYFSRIIKLPGLVGEAISLGVLWKFVGPRACGIYACLPAAILISGFHGNSDCLCAALVLVAVIAFDCERYFISGLLWGAALNVKLIPLVLLPLPILSSRKWRNLLKLSAGLALGIISFLPTMARAAKPMYRNLLAYQPNPDNWGISAFLNSALDVPRLTAHAITIQRWYSVNGRYVILLSILAIAALSALQGRTPLAPQAALGSATFLLLASGFGVQYVEFIAPLLCYVDLSAGFWWGWTSGLFIGVVYWIFWGPNLQSVFLSHYPGPAPLLGILSWAILAHFAWVNLRSLTVGAFVAITDLRCRMITPADTGRD